mgnify:CR=1 FL=1
MRMCSIQTRERSGTIRSCSIRSPTYGYPESTDQFESSYEKTGPFGAKSIGELVIDTPCPAIANAVYNATGVRVRELPITPEKVAMGILEQEAGEKK